ncbi:MAG TPA: hypothetical protein VFB12_27330 [Ktedonobacteraceae bacterium]|nr:hypothetical protein [Ktedonobacteraceae bacterium]
MALSSRHIWSSRFLLLAGLILAGQIILGLIVYLFLGHSYARTELALTAFLLLAGTGILALLWEPSPRKIVLGAGVFVLIALFALMVVSGLQRGIDLRQPLSSLPLALSPIVLVLALLAFVGKAVTRKEDTSRDIFYQPYRVFYQSANWFARLSHLALAGLAAIELVLQLSFGNQLSLLSFTSQISNGLSLNSAVVLLLAAFLVISLLRIKIPLMPFDGWMILILGIICSLFQYTFGARELAHIDPSMSHSLVVGNNLALSIIPLVLSILALFSEWERFFTPLWLTLQLLILQPFLPVPSTRTGINSILQPTLLGQSLIAILAIALILLAFRLVIYWDNRQPDIIDGISVTLIALIGGLTIWSLGQSDLHQTFLNTQRGSNQLSLADGLITITYAIAITFILVAGLICARRLLRGRHLWLEYVQNVVSILLVLAVTIGALLLLNSIGSQSNYLAATTLNPHALNASLPSLSLRNQYILDGLFALMLLLYLIALLAQRRNRAFAHIERILMLLSGAVCLLILASPGRQAILPLVTSNLQQIAAHILPWFTAEHIATTAILLASLISLLWFNRISRPTYRIILLALFGLAALCALIYYILASPILLLIPLLLLLAGTLIASRLVLAQADFAAQPTTPVNNATAHSPVS